MSKKIMTVLNIMGRITAICQFRWEVGSVYNCDGGSEFGEGGGMMLDRYTITKWYLHETLSIHFLAVSLVITKKRLFKAAFYSSSQLIIIVNNE